jgi:site-specific DNA-methyltransferase (adenine-specific)
VQAVITDPPYGSTDCDWDRKIDLHAWWSQIERLTTVNAVIVIFSAQPFTTALINSRPRLFRYDLVWDKLAPVGFLNANRQPLRVHEQMLIFCRAPGKSVYQPQKIAGKPYISRARANRTPIYRHHRAVSTFNTGWRHPTSILRFHKPHASQRRHPTEKPLPLLSWLVQSYTRRPMTILDPFMGSGSAGEAALRAGRRFIGIEQDRRFFNVAKQRLADAAI